MSPRRRISDDGPFRDMREPLQRDRPEMESFVLEDADEELDSLVTDRHDGDGDDDAGPDLLHGLPRQLSYLLKALYFTEALGSSTWGRFGTLYYVEHHMNAAQIGALEAALTAVPTVGMPLWGLLADRYQSRKAVYVGTKIVSTAVLLSLALPQVYNSIRAIVWVSVATKVFVSGGILDAFTLEALGKKHQGYYGRYRLYASLSWGVGAMIMGYSTNKFGFEPNFVLYGLLGVLCIVLVIWKIPDTGEAHTPTNLLADEESDNEGDDDEGEHQFIPPTEPEPRLAAIGECVVETPPIIQNDLEEPLLPSDDRRAIGGNEHDPSEATLWDLIKLFFRPRVAAFCLEVVVMGAAMATVERLLFIYMVNELESSTTLCGFCVGVNVLFELPIFWYAAKIKRWCGGSDGMQAVAMVGYVTRVYGYTLLTPNTRLWMLPLESLHGVTFACFWIVLSDVTKVLLVEMEGPKQSTYWSTTLPCLVQMLYSAVGVSFGSVLGGHLLHKYGGRALYRSTSGMICVLLAFHLIGCASVRMCRKRGREEGVENSALAVVSFLPDFKHNDGEHSETDDNASAS